MNFKSPGVARCLCNSLSHRPIPLIKKDFKIVDDDKTIASNGFLKNIAINTSILNGVETKNVKFDVLEETKQEKIDGVWSDTIVSFGEGLNYQTCSFFYKGNKCEIRPDYRLINLKIHAKKASFFERGPFYDVNLVF